jgi:hypothetical protein
MANEKKGIPFGRAIARELTAQEMDQVAGGDTSWTLTHCIRSITEDCGDGSQTD